MASKKLTDAELLKQAQELDKAYEEADAFDAVHSIEPTEDDLEWESEQDYYDRKL